MLVTSSPHPATMLIVRLSPRVLSTLDIPMEHAIHKAIESRRAYKHRRHTLALAMVMAMVIAAALAVLLVG
jgi:hypothetical protein